MIVLGVHMGHDAAVSLIADGRIVSHIERERLARIKHAAIATRDEISACLSDAGIMIDDVDRIAVTTTQNWPFLFPHPKDFRFRYAPDRADDLHVPGFMRQRWIKWFDQMAGEEARARKRLLDFQRFEDTRDLFADGIDAGAPDSTVLFTQQLPYRPEDWLTHHRSDDVRSGVRSLVSGPDWPRLRAGCFHIPILATIFGREIAGAVIPHHLAHAATAFYGSDSETAAILTHDGGHEVTAFGVTGGLHCIGRGTQLYPLWLNHAVGGNLYRRVADACGFKGMGGPGKLMGLAPYGSPRFHDSSWVGSGNELAERHPAPQGAVPTVLYERAWPYIRDAAEKSGTPQPIPAPSPLTPFSTDLAASIQETFEQQALDLVSILSELCSIAGIETGTLCLTGGCALNCPANSRVWAEGKFSRVFVPPTCDDSGLAIGAAFYLAHTVMGDERAPQSAEECGSAYLGQHIPDSEVRATLQDGSNEFVIDENIEPGKAAAEDLKSGRVIAWFEGRSEIGPRALGHRSIIADARDKENWRRVNELKSREQWRPLAPAVLAHRAQDWFSGAPEVSPHMLFTAQVDSDHLPAITHVDGSARLQTVDSSSGQFHDLLTQMEAVTGVPVVLNTSLNGRGQPIVETPDQALELFRRMDLDALYLEGRRITRPEAA